MLLIDKVILKTKYNTNLDYYKNLGYNVEGDDFEVNINHLLKNSFTLVKVSCDYCNTKEEIPYYKWNRSMESIVKKYCCNLCKGDKIKESNLIKYGVTSVGKLETSKEKTKKTNLEKFGVEFVFQSNKIKEKTKKTNLEKFGVENPMQNKQIKQKQRETLIKNWNVDNISKLDIIKERKKETTFTNWGVHIPLLSDEIKEKVRQTNLKKCGEDYFTKSEKFRKENYKISNDPFYIKYLENGISLFKCDCNEEHNFIISKDVYCKRKLYNINLYTVCNSINDNKSIKEKNLYEFISNSYTGEVSKLYRDGKMEIDIFLPDLKIGFEFNGLYWHSDEYKSSYFHLNKTNYFKEKGIRLIHIWEDDWDFKRDIVKSQILNLLSLNQNKIFARNCEVKILTDNKLIKSFLNENHIQGYVNSVVKLGLFNNGDLVSIMTFDKFEGRKKMDSNDWNLNRFCNKLGTTVIGGASKLFKYFNKNYNPKRIISYADKDWSIGKLYYKLGFNLISETKPDYKYIIDGKRTHKSKWRKSKTGISESKLNISKIWDCGKIKFCFVI